jgi:hypothetical protein
MIRRRGVLLLSLLSLSVASLVYAKAPERILAVDRVTVSNTGHTITIHARGTVGSPGWTAPTLRLVSASKTEWLYDFIATPPTRVEPQVITPISAVTHRTAAAPLRIRVRAKTNEKVVDVPRTEGKEAVSTASTGKAITVIGKLTGEGVECHAMREDRTNTLYTLTGNLKSFKDGDHVKVVGTIAQISTCMQGTTVVVSSISRAP